MDDVLAAMQRGFGEWLRSEGYELVEVPADTLAPQALEYRRQRPAGPELLTLSVHPSPPEVIAELWLARGPNQPLELLERATWYCRPGRSPEPLVRIVLATLAAWLN